MSEKFKSRQFYLAQLVWYCAKCQHPMIQKACDDSTKACYVCGEEADVREVEAVNKLGSIIMALNKEGDVG